MFQAISVTKYNNYIKQIFDAEELLHNISIVGEVFGVSFSRQVLYFSLKDDKSSISCVCFFPQFSSLLKEGDSVVITGSPNYYQKSGKLNFNVIDVKPSGQGLNYLKFLEMKEKLEKEGLFDVSHKKPIPKDIKRIGVITSKEGAVIRDIINVTRRRNKSVDIVLFPVKVQGNGAEEEIAYAIEKFSDYENIDVIIVARGGGSLEDLWAFNTEIVARAVYNSRKPVVSAVGHETDFTIIDFVSDLRAPTPSAAAEILTEDVKNKLTYLKHLMGNFKTSLNHYYQTSNFSLDRNIDEFNLVVNRIENLNRNRFNKTIYNFEKSLSEYVKDSIFNLSLLENGLNKLSPIEVLKRGYAKIEQSGKVVDKACNLVLSSEIEINFSDGKVFANPIKKEDEKWNMKKL